MKSEEVSCMDKLVVDSYISNSGILLCVGAVLAFLTVALGAFGAHAIRGRVPAERLANYQTGVQYQMFHALALLVLGCWYRLSPSALVMWAAWLMVAGVVLFSGSLYALTFTGQRRWGAVTPLGGLCFLGGWLCAMIAAIGLLG